MQGINVFTNATARDAAIIAPAEGQFAFTKDNNTLWYYDGAAWLVSGATGDIEGVTVTSPLTGGGTSGTVTVGILSGTTSNLGAVQLSDSTSSTSTTLAATANAVKTSYDLAAAAIPKSTVTTSGDVIYATGSSALTRLGIGSTGQVLTVAAGVPSWATPSSGAATWTRVANGTLSGSSISVSVNAAEILISLPGFSQSGSTAPFVRVNNDATSGNYGVQNNETDTGIKLWGNASSGGNSFCYINGANTTAIMKFGLANLYPSFVKISSAITSVQILPNGGSGTWSGGSYEVWTR
jgi:hypothetical protein